MPHAIAVRCPHCGASLQVDPRADSATCAYCGTTSLLRGKPTMVPGEPPVIVVRPRGGGGMIAFAVIVAAVVMTVLVLTFMAASPSPPSQAIAAMDVAPQVVHPVAAEPPAPVIDDAPRREVERLETGRRPLLADVDGDGLDDVVALAALHEGERRWDAFVAFSGATGEQLWQVAVPEDARGTFAAVAHGRLLVLGGAGQVSGHDLATGQQQWSTALGDRGLRLCAATEPDAVLVPTADARVLQLDVKTGKQSPSKATTCTPLPGDQDLADDDPRDRTDTRAPPGVVAVRCGSVRVIGSQNFTVPDACRKRAQVDPDRLGGLVAHALWQTPQGWLILGVRDPGTHTPLLARMQDRAIAWKIDVPDGNPLLADEGGPSPVALAGDLVIAGYTLQKDSRQFIGAFALSDGARRWHVEVPGGKRVDRAAAAGKQLLLYAAGSIFVLDVTTGALLRTIGPAPAP